MAKTFLPKGTDLSEEVIVKLQKGFKIFDADILDIEDILKKSGVIFDSDPNAEIIFFPFEGETNDFLKGYLGGRILKIKKKKLKPV